MKNASQKGLNLIVKKIIILIKYLHLKLFSLLFEKDKIKGKFNFQGENKMKKYKCKVCGYIYDPEVGEARTKTDPGVSFEDLPDEWHCPKCGAGKIRFQAMG